MANLDCKKPVPCVDKDDEKEIYPPATEEFTLCVGDRVLEWDGTRAKISRPRHTADGVYTSVTVVDGCIVDYGHTDVATYTPPYCNPNPADCQDSSGGNGAAVIIAPHFSNTLVDSPLGLFAKTYIQGISGISVTGIGTQNNPYRISVDNSAIQDFTIRGRNGVVTETDANRVTYVELEETGVKTGVYDINDQFTVDSYGRIIAVEERTDAVVSAGAGLEATAIGDTINLAHPTHNIDDTVVLGAYGITLSNTGHVTGTERLTQVTPGVYAMGAFDVSINEYGTIVDVEANDDVLSSGGTFVTVDGKTLTYDLYGRITDVSVAGNPRQAPLPLRDMFRLAVSSGALSKEVYGDDQQTVLDGAIVRVNVPEYVVDSSQVSVNGASSWTIAQSLDAIEVTYDGDKPFTVAFRG